MGLAPVDNPFFVFTAVTCRNCHEVIYGQHTLLDTVSRAALVMHAKEVGAVQSGDKWFCSRSCRTKFQLSPGLPSAKYVHIKT